MILLKDLTIKDLENLLGEEVVIKDPQITGRVEEIIISRSYNTLVKVKAWIEGEVYYYVVSCDEVALKSPAAKAKLRRNCISK